MSGQSMSPSTPQTSSLVESSALPVIHTLTIGIVAGEASGDSLGADFMQQMNNLRGDIVWVGVGGTKMQAQGLQSLFELERLAVMGLVEVVGHLPDLLQARSEILTAFNEVGIDWFIGVDAPDFNLRVARKLKPQGVFCVQYVSPSIWAWRESRIKTIKKATHLVLCLFPFELPVYERHHHPAICVGHPLLHSTPQYLLDTPIDILRRDIIWQNVALRDFFSARTQDISQLICMMPGSRRGEINTLLPLMLGAMNRLLLVDNELCFVIPTLNQNQQFIVQDVIDKYSSRLGDERVKNATVVTFDDALNSAFNNMHDTFNGTVEDKQANPNFSQSVMALCDIIVLASGTATLEAMLVNRPMVVVYKLNQLTYAIASRLVKVPYVALPNILAGEQIVAELIQEEATVDNVCREVTKLMQPRAYNEQIANLAKTTQLLREQSAQSPAHAVVDVWLDVTA